VEEFGRKRSCPKFQVLSWNPPEGTEENHKKLEVEQPFFGDFKPGPPEHEEVLIA
jgi:hypothetical protein